MLNKVVFKAKDDSVFFVLVTSKEKVESWRGDPDAVPSAEA